MDSHIKTRSSCDSKIVNDIVHGIIKIPPYIRYIIDSEQFQRLRNISQLGFDRFVYPSSGNSRFEHSIGTFHLASLLINQLKQQDDIEDLKKEFTNEDIKCVEIAALCHDLGHGSFSHFWEHAFEEFDEEKKHIKPHETLSTEIFEDLINNKVNGKCLKDLIDLNDDMVKKIKCIIKGQPCESRYMFLYQIVANKKSGLDVDKLDYLCRDSIYLGWSNKNKIHDVKRILNFFRIVKVKTEDTNEKEDNVEWHLAMRDREIFHIYDVFYCRHLLFRYGYYHKTAVAVESMIKDALHNIFMNDPQYLFELIINVNGTEIERKFKTELDGILNTNETIDEDNAGTLHKLVGWKQRVQTPESKDLLLKILYSKEFISKCWDFHVWYILEKYARPVINRIQTRQIYKLFYKLKIRTRKPNEEIKKKTITKELEKLFKMYLETSSTYTESSKASVQVSVILTTFSLSSEKGNPIYNILFYKKGSELEAEYFNTTMNLPPPLMRCRNEEHIVMIFANKVSGNVEGYEKYDPIRYQEKKHRDFINNLTQTRNERQSIIDDCLNDIYEEFYKPPLNKDDFKNDLSDVMNRLFGMREPSSNDTGSNLGYISNDESDDLKKQICQLHKHYIFRESKY